MKPRLVNMLTIAKKLIINQPKTSAFIERDCAAMNNRVSIVFRNYLVEIIPSLPLQHARLRFVANHKRCVHADRVLFKTIDLYCRMIGGGAKLVSLREDRRINVRSRIDDERAPARRDFNT